MIFINRFAVHFTLLCLLCWVCSVSGFASETMKHIIVGKDGKTFCFADSKLNFRPIGFNYDHDRKGRLIEDYWIDEWNLVEKDFRAMKQFGATVVRIHLQLGKFLCAPDQVDSTSLRQLEQLVKLAEQVGLYLDITGLGCYHKADVPEWYDQLVEKERWKQQALFWSTISKTCAASPAIFCYDLMNEPVVAGGKRKPGDWLGPAFAGKHFVQFVSLDQAGRERVNVARAWIEELRNAIRQHDSRHLITVGLVDWSLERPGLTSGFVPSKIADQLDFLAVHLYPTRDLPSDLNTLQSFSVGKPLVIEETFPLKCSLAEFESFLKASQEHSAGFIGFYWGEIKITDTSPISDHISKAWLDFFEKYSQASQ